MLKKLFKRMPQALMLALAAIASFSFPAMAEEPTAAHALFVVNNTWMLVATFLVFIMHLGFATLESGLTRSKNTVNILFKNVMIVAIGLLTYAIIGFNLMYPGDDGWISGKWLGLAGGALGVSAPEGAAGLIDYADGAYTYWTDFIFQAMFAATAATIVSGAVAERIKLHSFLLFSVIFVGLVYPFVGSWKWGGGWLNDMGFYDFAGSTLVHSVGGWGALAGVIVLGPRLGKYVKGVSKAMPGHSMPLAAIGVFLLWLGWFGFNGGSVLSADPGPVSIVFVTTTLAAAAGIIGAMITSEVVQKKPDLSMVLNGALAGLVGITAGADSVTVMSSVIIGLIAGVLVVVSVIFIDSKLQLDDPVGALSVHLVCGIWGTLAVGIFSTNPEHSFMTQLIGVIAYGAVCFPAALAIFSILKATIGIRVSEQEEYQGLDIGEHGMEAYAGFQIFTNE
ncbi:Ammonium transporter [hydrothermal vent metagenome]|uniref:Ammonium transporter n=1 Tax=hydrothermal vent metagenome TaxID=652676 RepID=A0A3B1CZF6_9ZZZZ